VRDFCLISAALLWASVAPAATPIAEVKEIDSGGLPVMFGQEVTVAGVVTAGSGTFSSDDLDIYIQDRTGGINVYLRGAGLLVFETGDSVEVTGYVDQAGIRPLRGNTRVTLGDETGIQVLGAGTVPEPLLITGEDLSRQAEPPLEPYEGLLVRIEGVTFDTGDWPGAGEDAEIEGNDGTEVFKFRIDEDTGIGGSPEPRLPVIMTGVVVQNSGYPYLSRYFLWPRDRYGGFLATGPGSGVASLEPVSVDTDTPSFDLTVRLAGNGMDTIRAFTADLPLADGWTWSSPEAGLSGPGLEGAALEITAGGVLVRDAGITGEAGYGEVVLEGIAPPEVLRTSQVVIETSVDGVEFEPLELQPTLKAVFPIPPVIISEVYPHDGSTGSSNAFVEIHNQGAGTAYLEDFAVCEPRPVSYCDLTPVHVLGTGDSLEAGGYLVIAASAQGFEQRFGFPPDVEADISPLGRSGGDGAVCGGEESYEVISLWRDQELSELVDYYEYKDGVACTDDLCPAFRQNAVPVIPPEGYALIWLEIPPSQPYLALTSHPTPGDPNIQEYSAPRLLTIRSHTRRIVEVIFSEPVLSSDGTDSVSPEQFTIDGARPTSIFRSLSMEKYVMSFDGLSAGEAKDLSISGLESPAGIALADTTSGFTVSRTVCSTICEVQSYDDRGYSPLNGEGVCVVGFITVPQGVFQPDYNSIYVQGLDGCGVNVFAYDKKQPAPAIGDLVYISGEVEEYVSSSGAGSTTEILMSSPGNLTVLSAGYPEPEPLVVRTGRIWKEEYEGRLIFTEGAITDAGDIDFYIDDGTGGIQVYQNYTDIDFSRFTTGMYVRVKGVVLQYDYTVPFFEGYELVPRFESDIEIVEDAFPRGAVLSVPARVFCPSCGEEGVDIVLGSAASSRLTLRMYDVRGRSVATLYDGDSVGEMTIRWDGRDRNGELVAPGLYVCYLESVEKITGRTTTESAPIVVGMELK
jgi:hypothetical protein